MKSHVVWVVSALVLGGAGCKRTHELGSWNASRRAYCAQVRAARQEVIPMIDRAMVELGNARASGKLDVVDCNAATSDLSMAAGEVVGFAKAAHTLLRGRSAVGTGGLAAVALELPLTANACHLLARHPDGGAFDLATARAKQAAEFDRVLAACVRLGDLDAPTGGATASAH